MGVSSTDAERATAHLRDRVDYEEPLPRFFTLESDE